MSLRLAVVQTAAPQALVSGAGLRELRDALRTQHLGTLRQLAADRVAIAVLPEMADLPFSLAFERERLLEVATDLGAGEDLFFSELRRLSDESGMVILYPTLEKAQVDGQYRLHSATFVVMPSGGIEIVRKRLRAREEGLFEKDVLEGYREPGFQVFGNGEFRFGVTMDRGGVFFRTAEMLAEEAGASLILNPRAQLHSESQRILDEELRLHARQHGYALALANRVGERASIGEAFSGHSQILGSSTEEPLIASGMDAEVCVLEVNLPQRDPTMAILSRVSGAGRVALFPKELH